MVMKQQWESFRSFLNMIWQTNPPKLLLIIAIGMSIMATLVGLVIPWFMKDLVDQFSQESITSTQVIILVITFVVQAISGGFSIYILARIGQSIVANLRDRLWRKLLVLPIAYYDEHLTGDTISRMTNDTGVVKGLITSHMTGFFTGIIAIIGSVTILIYMDWQMTLIMLTAVPLSLAALIPLGMRMHKISKGLQDETARFTTILSQVLSEIRLVKASNAELNEYRRGNEGIRNLFRFGLREGFIHALIGPLVSLVLMVMLVIVIGYGGMRVASGALSAGELVAFILYLFQIIMPMTQITSFFTELQKAIGATERIIITLDSDEEEHETGEELVDVHHPIIIDNLTFAYDHGETILQDISFTLEPGKVTAIVGPSGGGKTTLFSLLERFYEPKSGVIRLGEVPIQDFSLHSWRSRIGYVSQESPLIAGTIRDNICYGMDREVSIEDIELAARMAYADEFIAEFPEQFETEVGERGIKLSGGQRQRIGIARALLRDPQILMLDEATSSLDSRSEVAVQYALANLMKGRTTLVIAHRLSTVVDANRIIFIDKGMVTGMGTHEELYESHEMYREFATHQLRVNG